ncbi:MULTISPECIES: Mu transposase C-terminal domain-containing protein [unclassified Mesorhizobium]|uniref:Mu transposase C-terminal domain-containing protein n=1 Tax=unclassified Mesorhizobium TaxID=325217 RepID=UPI001FE1F897|nr:MULTISPECIES: Mu transposase C-terminal domain-containing protein [unclassified Mesorhizobium]
MRPTGIHLFGLRYWSAALSADVGRSDRRLLVKYDPRDLARIFVRRPSGNFVEARYADVTLPSITLHEALTARRTLLAKGRREVDTRAIVRTAMAQRELVDAATRKTARLSPVADELLSSWIGRHAAFYSVPPLVMLRHCLPEASALRAADLHLSSDRKSAWPRCSPPSRPQCAE